MYKYNLNSSARRENMRALANSLDISEDEAGIKLGFNAVLRYSKKTKNSKQYVKELYDLLVRTIESVSFEEAPVSGTAEIDIRSENPSTLYVLINNNSFTLALEPIPKPSTESDSHPLFILLTACYSSAAILKLAVPAIPLSCKLPMQFNLSDIIIPSLLTKKINLDKCYMAGAGAIGNALLWCFRHLDIHGELHICDDDKVSEGNLNRQLFFNEIDIGKYKTEVLAKKAHSYLPNLKLVSRTNLLQDLEEAGNSFWLSRLISAVDSRRARRTLQGEYPKEVFDASTTDISEVIIYYHKQPTSSACISCVYSEDDKERSHESNIAESLGIEIEEIKKGRISKEIAKTIIERFPDENINASEIEGEAYDSFYKVLCGQGSLQNVEQEQMLAPFCFVSALAGIMLSIEIVKRLSSESNTINYNFWKVSAWHPPYSKMQRNLPRKPGCISCGSPSVRQLIEKAWS